MLSEKRVVVVPPYNAERTLRQTVVVATVIVNEVGEASKDNTFELARELGLHSLRHIAIEHTAAINKPAAPAAS